MKKTVTDIIEDVKNEMCKDFCKYVKESEEALDEDREFYCPLDRL